MMASRRFTPYGTCHARPSMYGNTEAGPSIQLPPPIPYGIHPTTQPTGGTSGTVADAEQNQMITEEEESPVSGSTALLFLM